MREEYTMKPAYTIPKLYEEHKRSCPDSCLSERAIRLAAKEGNLHSVKVGNRTLISIEAFNHWLEGKTTGGAV